MTYRQLLDELPFMTDEQLDSDVTIYSPEQDEWYPAESLLVTDEDDVLNINHPYITLK